MISRQIHILTFDVEEWFHLLDNDSTKTIKEWSQYESRIHANMDRIFDFLEKTNRKATFFCLGWIVEKYPDVIRDIVNRGYEIGSHSRMHQLVYEQKPKSFQADLEFSIKTLEDTTGQKVKYFRAPGFSIREDSKWAFEIMASLGIEVDCSIFPAIRSHGGFPSYTKPSPSILSYKGIILKELPINYVSYFGKPLIFSGGGYFRLVPYPLIHYWTKNSDYVMSYLHPRDFDYNQPIINELSLLRKFKSYVGLNGAAHKFEHWLTDFEFVDIGTALKSINWIEVPIVEIKD
jgi:polysaccharide deacetylase family protein (PEP-CTERM system associated)